MLSQNTTEEIVIDGSQGEGGGQIFRTSLTLSLCLGIPIRINNIRAGRRKPGLLRQHLTCLRAARDISSAFVSGDELGASSVRFSPGQVRAGNYNWSVGSAGSTTLVFQTVLLPLAMANGVSKLALEGGTHNGMAPSVDFIEQSFLPLLKKMGMEVSLKLEKYGFYPNGGGRWTVKIRGERDGLNKRRPLIVNHRGLCSQIIAVASSSHIPAHVVERELEVLKRKLKLFPVNALRAEVESIGPGNCVSLRAQYENSCAVFEVLGERRKPAEKVAKEAVALFLKWEKKNVTIEEYLADQLLLPMMFAGGGEFTTGKPSDHLSTNVDVICQLTGVQVTVEETLDRTFRVSVPPITLKRN